jgi:hypothetical protein
MRMRVDAYAAAFAREAPFKCHSNATEMTQYRLRKAAKTLLAGRFMLMQHRAAMAGVGLHNLC